MLNSTKILFTTDTQVQNNSAFKQFTERYPSEVFSTFLNGECIIIGKTGRKAPTFEDIRMLAGSMAKEIQKGEFAFAEVHGKQIIEAFPSLEESDAITAFVEGWYLGGYTFSTYKSSKEKVQTELRITGGEQFQALLEKGKIRAEAMAFSRDLMNEIPSVLNPSTYPEILKKEFANTGVEVKVFDKAELEEREMHGVLTVGRGSIHEPAFVELRYRGDESKPLVALVGKGVTFDTGGISLKKGKDISDMRMDMGGSAAVAGAMKLIAASEWEVNVVALIPVVENIPDNTAVIPGDVIHYKNGMHVQVGNTDAEGRLILADGLLRAGELEANYVIDIATLTGAIVHALGSKLAGVFGDDILANELKTIGLKNGDHVWPMPLVDEYFSYLHSDYADFNNTSGKGEAGSIVAALFLRKFVPENSKWLHIDMAGVMQGEDKGYYAKSATGFGARLLADFTTHVSNKN
ncbi:M17 family metallopeptidase [Virgibacillus sp. SK37]|uniref:leucyl aminopeptidase family protein n=1 Tax=Virgibacillus sp. SK37 TaxID=403957 RepID=UPI0004D0C208|nr:leucyl aminopeptidase family protein [Virgibacillus sp. SK37]AIF44260.1 peptidase M17 [Virgibacillus sp. SK37]